MSILKYHFTMAAKDFSKYREEPKAGLSMMPIPATVDSVIERVGKIPWDWIHKDIYSPEALETRLNDMKLYDLMDGDEPIGYTIITPPSSAQAFEYATADEKVIEIENLALFPQQEGKKRGWQLFTMVMDKLFEENDHVYWSQSSSNYKGLKEYYERQGMTYLGAEEVPDFRPMALKRA